MAKIKSIYGPEPLRSGEWPVGHVVGFDGVTHIDEKDENLGTYGIHWFCVWAGDQEICRLNAVHVAQVDFVREVSAA